MFSDDDFLIVLHVIINIIKRIVNCSAYTLSIKISGKSFPLRIMVRTYKLKIFIFIEERYEFVRERIDLVPIMCYCFKDKLETFFPN